MPHGDTTMVYNNPKGQCAVENGFLLRYRKMMDGCTHTQCICDGLIGDKMPSQCVCVYVEN